MICLKQTYVGACRTHAFQFALNFGTAGYTCNACMQRRMYSYLPAPVHISMQVTAPCFGWYTQSSCSTHTQ